MKVKSIRMLTTT